MFDLATLLPIALAASSLAMPATLSVRQDSCTALGVDATSSLTYNFQLEVVDPSAADSATGAVLALVNGDSNDGLWFLKVSATLLSLVDIISRAAFRPGNPSERHGRLQAPGSSPICSAADSIFLTSKSGLTLSAIALRRWRTGISARPPCPDSITPIALVSPLGATHPHPTNQECREAMAVPEYYRRQELAASGEAMKHAGPRTVDT